jgi:hypothetical protein
MTIEVTESQTITIEVPEQITIKGPLRSSFLLTFDPEEQKFTYGSTVGIWKQTVYNASDLRKLGEEIIEAVDMYEEAYAASRGE